MNKISREMNSSDYRVRNIYGKCHAIVFHDDYRHGNLYDFIWWYKETRISGLSMFLVTYMYLRYKKVSIYFSIIFIIEQKNIEKILCVIIQILVTIKLIFIKKKKSLFFVDFKSRNHNPHEIFLFHLFQKSINQKTKWIYYISTVIPHYS